MAEGLLRHYSKNKLEVYSAGSHPAEEIAPAAITVMDEIGIDIGEHYPKSIDFFKSFDIDYSITVCDNASNE